MPINPNDPLINIQAGEPQSGGLAGSSWLQYGNILLTDVITESYEMEEVRSQDQSQVLSIHHVLKVTGIINPAVNNFKQLGEADNPKFGYVSNSPPLRGVPDLAMKNVFLLKNWLLIDRQNLDWSIDGVMVLRSPTYQFDNPTVRHACDSNQGPKPLYCQVTQISGTGSFYVRFGIETWVDKCTATLAGRFVQSHRYSMAHDVDGDTWLTTRMVTGHVKFRPEYLERSGIPPDKVIRQYFHPIPEGFKRSRPKVQALPNGMEVAYSFIDQEVTLPLGSLSPATKLTAEFSISSSIGGDKAANTVAAVHVAAAGPKDQFRSNLLVMALRIALQKVQKPGHVLTSDIMITYSLDNTFVDVSMKAIWKPVGIGPEGLQIRSTGMGATDDYDDIDTALEPFRNLGESPQGTGRITAVSPKMVNYGSMGTYVGFCIGSSLVNGCFGLLARPDNEAWSGTVDGRTDDDVSASGGGDIDSLVDVAGNEVPFDYRTVDTLTMTELDTGLSNESVNGDGWYEDWQSDVRYHTNHQIAVMPIGATQNPSPGDALSYVPPQFATLGFPFTLKSVDFSIAWIGPDPSAMILPSPDTGDANDVLLAEDISPAVPTICNSTNKGWRVTGTYWYGQKKLRTSSLTAKVAFDYTDDGFAMGKSVLDPYNQTANTIGLTRFIAGYSPSFV